ncbi:tetratricopeptide repeat protein [Planktomarina temperata]|nr:tetratricopeptide repeat protein [Planktomarina temperata]
MTELTIDQALQQGIEAHKAGRVQEADRLYTAILKAQPKHPDANHNMGVLAVGVGKVQEALPFFKTALEANPTTAQFWLSYIDTLIKLDKLADAQAVLDQAKSKGVKGDGFDKLEQRLQEANKEYPLDDILTETLETNQNSTLDIAIKLRESGEFNQAIDLLKDEINRSPADSDMLALLSHCYLLADQVEEAKLHLEKARTIAPDNASVGWNTARLTLKEKKPLEALNVARDTTRRFPDDVEGMGVLGACLRANGEVAESLEVLNKAIELNPDYAEALVNRGFIRLSKENKSEAVADLELAHKLKPHIKQIWDVIIGLKVEAQEYSDTIVLLLNMITIDPEDEKRLATLALCYQHLKDFETSEEFYNKALAIKPDYATAHINLGSALKEQGKLEQAIEFYNKGLAIKPDNAEAYNNMGNALKEQGKLEEAIEAFNKARAIKPDYAAVYNNMGTALKEQGKLEEAIKAYEKALAIKSDYTEAYYNMGEVLRTLGRLKEAVEAFKKEGSIKSQTTLLKCLYELDEPNNFFDQLDYLVKKNVNNAVIGSYISRSKIKYGIERTNPFCNQPLRYTLHTNLTSRCNFEDIFIKGATEVLNNNKVQSRQQNLLTNGIQTTGNVFNQIENFTDEIENIIRSEVEKYRSYFKDSQEGLIKHWPSDYEIRGWLISMKSGGKLAAHMHDNGWISGSVYINVPPKVNRDSGNFVVCLDHGQESQSIDVVTGSLCLFPSSLLHYTIPFEAEENRIVLAFDVIPK